MTADVNGDGKLDLVSARRFANTLPVLTNNGSGGFTTSTNLTVGLGPLSVAAADVNGDGRVDLISANSDANTLSVLFNTPAFAGRFVGDGSGLTGITGASLAAGTISNANLAPNSINTSSIVDGSVAAADINVASFSNTFWKTDGNAGTTPGTHFIGTTDNQPLEIKSAGSRVMRIEANTNGAPNIIGGSQANSIAPGIVGATIAGGGATNYFGVAYSNRVEADFGTVGGDYNNSIQPGANDSFLGGGYQNSIKNGAVGSFLGGGRENSIGTNAQFSVIAGGRSNAVGSFATNAFAAGYRAKANHPGAFVWADSQNADFGSSANNQFLIRASGGVGIGVTAPGFQLDVNDRIRLRGTGNTFAAGAWLYDKASSSDRAFVGLSTTNQFGIYSPLNGLFNFVVNQDNGNVGIGTTTPSTKLTVAGSGNYLSVNAAAIVLDNTSANGRKWEWHSIDDGRMQLNDYDAGGSGTRIIIATNGDVSVSHKLTFGTFPVITSSALIPVNGGTITPLTGFVILTPASSITSSVVTAIASGTTAGQMLILQGAGTNTVTVMDNANTRLAANLTLGSNDTLTVIWNGSAWTEQSFSNNN